MFLTMIVRIKLYKFHKIKIQRFTLFKLNLKYCIEKSSEFADVSWLKNTNSFYLVFRPNRIKLCIKSVTI